MRNRCLILAALLPAAAAAQERQDAAVLSGRLREIRITTGDIFVSTKTPALLEELIDGLHWTTQQSTVAREIWFSPGDVVNADQAAELERNLRALGLFADVTVQLVPAPTAGEVDLEVSTRDRLTLTFGGGASYVGGVTGVNAGIGESNLFGLGDRAAVSFRQNSEDEYRWAFVYSDLHLFDTWHTSTVRLASTDEGDSFGFDVQRPFKHLTDPRSYGASVNHDEIEVDYYRGGDSLAQVPDVRGSLRGDLVWGDGPVDSRRRFGFFVATEQHDYDAAQGPLAASIRVPGDTWWVHAGPTARWQLIDGYRKVEGLDTLAYVQDLTLGLDLGATLGARWREEEGGGGGDLQPEVAIDVSWAAEICEDLYTNIGAGGGLRLDGGEAVGWNGTVGARAYAMLSDQHTLCGRVAFDGVEETQDLLLELTLGEDNGLRGYPSREFSGTRRLRTNLEHRFDTNIEFATLRLGLVGFFDTGWMGDGGSLGRPWSSAGVGIRVGTKPLLGGGVLRIDFAKPFEEAPGEDDHWTVSVAAGQIFTF